MISRVQLKIQVVYTAPVFDSRRILRVLPLQRPNQTILAESLQIFPQTEFQLEKADPTGNRRLLLRHKRLETEFRFSLDLEIQSNAAPFAESAPDFARWKMPSRATLFTPELQKIARQHRTLDSFSRAQHFCALIHDNLAYQPQTSDKPDCAAAIWNQKRGNCADFAHVFLALCRISGLAARYVAGFGLAPGQMHAWAEVWCDGLWHAFDPTLGRAASPGNVVISLGRDFYDCAPHSGTFRGDASAKLDLRCQNRLD